MNKTVDYNALRMKAAENVCNELLQILQNCSQKTDSKNFTPQDSEKLVDALNTKYFSILPNNPGETGFIAERTLKTAQLNPEDRYFYWFLIDFIKCDIMYFTYPIEIIKRESPDFIVRDRNKKIAIECTQIISKFHSEKCNPYQSALIRAFYNGEEPPKKAKYGICSDIVKTVRGIPIPNGRVHVFTLGNEYTKAELFETARKRICDKQSKADDYRKNASVDKILLLILVNGIGENTVKEIERNTSKYVNNKFDGVEWLCLSENDTIELYAPYEELT